MTFWDETVLLFLMHQYGVSEMQLYHSVSTEQSVDKRKLTTTGWADDVFRTVTLQ